MLRPTGERGQELLLGVREGSLGCMLLMADDADDDDADGGGGGGDYCKDPVASVVWHSDSELDVRQSLHKKY